MMIEINFSTTGLAMIAYGKGIEYVLMFETQEGITDSHNARKLICGRNPGIEVLVVTYATSDFPRDHSMRNATHDELVLVSRGEHPWAVKIQQWEKDKNEQAAIAKRARDMKEFERIKKEYNI